MKKKVKRVRKKKNTLVLPAVMLVLFFSLILFFIAIKSPQDIRQKAAEPTPTPLLRCGVPCTYNSQCPTGLYCYNNVCRNPFCKDAIDCVCIITPTPNPYATKPPPAGTPKPIVPTATSTPKTSDVTGGFVAPPNMSESDEDVVEYVVPEYVKTEEVPESGQEQSASRKSLLQLIIEYIGGLFCGLFNSCAK